VMRAKVVEHTSATMRPMVGPALVRLGIRVDRRQFVDRLLHRSTGGWLGRTRRVLLEGGLKDLRADRLCATEKQENTDRSAAPFLARMR
jgi:hypothetical protein